MCFRGGRIRWKVYHELSAIEKVVKLIHLNWWLEFNKNSLNRTYNKKKPQRSPETWCNCFWSVLICHILSMPRFCLLWASGLFANEHRVVANDCVVHRRLFFIYTAPEKNLTVSPKRKRTRFVFTSFYFCGLAVLTNAVICNCVHLVYATYTQQQNKKKTLYMSRLFSRWIYIHPPFWWLCELCG